MPYHGSSLSSGSAEKVVYSPRREHRDRKETRPVTKREVVVIHHRRPTEDGPRSSDMNGRRWK